MTDHITTKSTYLVATAAVSSPWWLEWLRDASEISGLVVPILGAFWLAIQIGIKLWSHFGKKKP